MLSPPGDWWTKGIGLISNLNDQISIIDFSGNIYAVDWVSGASEVIAGGFDHPRALYLAPGTVH